MRKLEQFLPVAYLSIGYWENVKGSGPSAMHLTMLGCQGARGGVAGGCHMSNYRFPLRPSTASRATHDEPSRPQAPVRFLRELTHSVCD